MADTTHDDSQPDTADVIQVDFHNRKAVDPDNHPDPKLVEPALVHSEWADTVPPRRWLMRGVIPDNRLGMLTGEGGTGKSRLAVQLAACIASGDDQWLPGCGIDLNGKPRPVVYLTYEDEQDEINRRLIDVLDGESPAQALGRRFKFVWGSQPSVGALWRPSTEGSQHTSTMGEPSDGLLWLQKYCEELKPALLVIDTVAAAFLSNENDRGLVTQFANYLDDWAIRTGTAVMLVGHPPKSGAKYSGSTGWRASVRWFLNIERQLLIPAKNGDKEVRWPALVVDKVNYGDSGEHDEPRWWFSTDRRRAMPLRGKASVVTKDDAKHIYELNQAEFARAVSTPPTWAYQDDGDI